MNEDVAHLLDPELDAALDAVEQIDLGVQYLIDLHRSLAAVMQAMWDDLKVLRSLYQRPGLDDAKKAEIVTLVRVYARTAVKLREASMAIAPEISA